MEMQKARPPYVTFETKAVERRSAEGEVTFIDVDYAYITQIGSKDRVERVAKEWFEQMREEVNKGRFEQEWLNAFKATFAAWKEGQEPPINGTAIKSWAALTPAQVKNLLNHKVHTVEDMAAANEETIARLGMGGRALKNQAQDWLKAQSAGGMADLVKRVESLAQHVERLEKRNAVVEADNAKLKAEVAAAKQVA